MKLTRYEYPQAAAVLTGPLPGTETDEFDDRSRGSKHRLGSAFPLLPSVLPPVLSDSSSGLPPGTPPESPGAEAGWMSSVGSALPELPPESPPPESPPLSVTALSSAHSPPPPVVAAMRQICTCAELVMSPPMVVATIAPTTATTTPSRARYSIAVCPVLVRTPRRIRSLCFTRHLVMVRPRAAGDRTPTGARTVATTRGPKDSVRRPIPGPKSKVGPPRVPQCWTSPPTGTGATWPLAGAVCSRSRPMSTSDDRRRDATSGTGVQTDSTISPFGSGRSRPPVIRTR